MKNLLFVVVFGKGEMAIHQVFEDKKTALDIFANCDNTTDFYVIKTSCKEIKEDLLEITSYGQDCKKHINDYCKVIA